MGTLSPVRDAGGNGRGRGRDVAVRDDTARHGDVRVDVLDTRAAPDPPAGGLRGWVAGAAAVVLLLAAVAGMRPSGDGDDPVTLAMTGHSGSALEGQRFVRVYFSVTASGGTAEVQDVAMVLGGARQGGSAPVRIREGSRASVLVDLVPNCPHAVLDLPLGSLEITYRAGGDEQVAHLPLPIEGSLPRLVQRRCATLDRV